MKTLWSFDPDTKHVAMAKFANGIFVLNRIVPFESLWHLRVVLLEHRVNPGDTVVCEVPHVTKGRNADPNDLVQLAMVCGVVASMSSSYHAILPHQWKGSMSKEVSHKRLLEHMAKVDAGEPYKGKNKSERLDALDSIAIGYSFLNHLRHV